MNKVSRNTTFKILGISCINLFLRTLYVGVTANKQGHVTCPILDATHLLARPTLLSF